MNFLLSAKRREKIEGRTFARDKMKCSFSMKDCEQRRCFISWKREENSSRFRRCEWLIVENKRKLYTETCLHSIPKRFCPHSQQNFAQSTGNDLPHWWQCLAMLFVDETWNSWDELSPFAWARRFGLGDRVEFSLDWPGTRGDASPFLRFGRSDRETFVSSDPVVRPFFIIPKRYWLGFIEVFFARKLFNFGGVKFFVFVGWKTEMFVVPRWDEIVELSV